MVGKRKPENRGLPARWAHKHGAYYYLPAPDVRHLWDGKAWFKLGHTLPEAFETWGKRAGAPERITTIGALLDRYALAVVPEKAPKTQTDNRRALGRLSSRDRVPHRSALPHPGGRQCVRRALEQRVRKVSPEVIGGIVEIVRGTPEPHGFLRPTWTLEVLARVIAEKLGVTLSVGHVGKIMKGLKVRWGLPRPVVGCPWPKARRQRRLAELRRLALHPRPREVVLYADEVDIHLNPKIGRDWMLPGTQRW